MRTNSSLREGLIQAPTLADVFLWAAAAISATLAALASIPAMYLLFVEAPKQARLEARIGDLYADLEKVGFMGVAFALVALFLLAMSVGCVWLGLRRRRYRRSAHVPG